MRFRDLSLGLLTLVACSSAKPVNQRASGLSNAPKSEQGGNTTAVEKQAADGTATAALTNASLIAMVAKHDDCTKQGKGWLPQTDPAKLADHPVGDCGADLVKFCCTLPKIQSLFAGTPADLMSHVQPLLDKKFQIYDCSQESGDQVKIHLLKFDGAAVSYTSLALSGLLADHPSGAAASCPKLDMNALLQSTGEATPAAAAGAPAAAAGAAPGSPVAAAPAPAGAAPPAPGAAPAPAPAAPPAVTFAATINPILTASCGGGSCHTDGTTQTVFVDNEANTKGAAAQIIDRLNAGTMPTGGKTISDSNKAILIKFLTP
ncbi:MAG: hypothetical protein NTZ90_10640 [Proteobacteria bacterium]|nr:hypothetical protein [Pseudomonadota bacterium]